jgi:transcriptional regulator with XRE-family HTH domain
MGAGPFLLFASREQRKCRKERTITKPLRQGLDIDIGRYENGTDRVSASRLYLIAEALGVGIGFFYGLDDAAAGIDTAAVAGSIGLLGRAVRDRGPRMLPRHDARTAQHLR